MMPLLERVIQLADLRDRAARSHALLQLRTEEFQRANAGLIENLKERSAAADAAEIALRAVAAEEYERTKERKPAPGIEIKLYKQYAINEVAGLAWAKEKDLCLIPASLDVAAIKKLATVQALSFVMVSEVPKVTIATDLSKLVFSEAAQAPAEVAS